MCDPYKEGIKWLYYRDHYSDIVWVYHPLRGKGECKSILSDPLNPAMKHFDPNRNLFQEDTASIHRSRGVTEQFHESRNDVNQIV